MQTDSAGRRLATGMLISMDSGFPDEDLQLEWWPHRKMWVAKRLPPHDPTPQNVMGMSFTIVRSHENEY